MILYADQMTNSLSRAIDETNRRRSVQQAYNEKHGITPKTVKREITNNLEIADTEAKEDEATELMGDNINKTLDGLKKDMLEAASNLEFEKAASLRDQIQKLEHSHLGIH